MTENDLIKKLKKGDNDGYFHLSKLYQNKLYYFCLKILKNSFDAQDAVQLTFIKISTSISSFKKRSALTSWIYKIAYNTCTDILRQKKKLNFVSLDELYTLALNTHHEKHNPETVFLSSESEKAIYNEIEKLPKKQKELIILRDVYGFSYKETAELLSLKEGTVKSGLNRARKKLKENLEKHLT